MNKTRSLISIAALASAAIVAGCAGYPYGSPVTTAPGNVLGLPGMTIPTAAVYGTVTGVQYLPANTQTGGLGNIPGSVLGAGLPTGSGDLASVATAVAVAVMANQAMGTTNPNATTAVYRVTVRLDSGETRAFDYASLPNLRVNDRVRVEGNQLYR